MLCGNPYIHTMRSTSDLWASDWQGNYNEAWPDGKEWMFTDYFTGEDFPVNPAIVHAMRCKDILIASGKASATKASFAKERRKLTKKKKQT